MLYVCGVSMCLFSMLFAFKLFFENAKHNCVLKIKDGTEHGIMNVIIVLPTKSLLLPFFSEAAAYGLRRL